MIEKNLFIPCSEDFHQAVKLYCIKKKVSMSDWITNLIEKELKKERIYVKQP